MTAKRNMLEPPKMPALGMEELRKLGLLARQKKLKFNPKTRKA